ncbi:hypothetical protein SAMN06272722_106126 [Paenibacillus sp. RU5A]|nr:hypothetical protein SAMN06272722_106126 [Paenibacillus sp. RU5A]SOC71614.1 hypothetical protein SAMN05880581_106126 [Paenibacillus sp. RU26A]SOC74014.1 hypothetical protein SAMN05880586_106126 [Paenibacillus sp. RU5M]
MFGNSSRKVFWLLLLIGGIIMTGFESTAEADADIRAAWVWQAKSVSDGGNELLDNAAKHKINRLYVNVDMNLSEDVYHTFISKASKAGIAVEALGGDPSWAVSGREGPMLKLASWVSNYNLAAKPEERFDAIHLDIKPYVLPQWKEDAKPLVQSWVVNMKLLLEQVKQAGAVEVNVDLPFWLDSYTVTGGRTTDDADNESLSHWFIGQFDHITLLAYRDSAQGNNGIIRLVEQEMMWADARNGSITVGVNTKPMPGEEFTTFAGKGAAQLESVIKEVASAFTDHASYAGSAVHDIVYWGQLEPEEVPLPENPSNQPEIRGTYIWQASQVTNDGGDHILEFAKEQNINWLYVRLDLDQPYSSYRSFVKRAQAQGIEVHAMGGHPIWGKKENRPRIQRLIDYVKNYNAESEPDERFKGIHLDIEPYTLPEWENDRDTLLTEWASNIAYFHEETKKDSDLETSADLAVWLDTFPLPGRDMSVSEYMITTLDHISLMAFRNIAEGSNGIADVVSQEMKIADRLGKPLLISVELKENFEGRHISFYDKGAAEMERQLALLPDLLSEYKAYKGNIVHAYDYWIQAKP